jgi:cytosine/adenosine deaminase-related metal-dependent hydrolase
MRPIPALLATALVASAGVAVTAGPRHQTPMTPDTITIRAARLLDGRGARQSNAVIEVRGSRIVAIDHRTGPVTRDLGDVTLMPGMIDVHVHVDWHFQPNGLFGARPGQPRETPEQLAAAVQANLDATLNAGFTTVQSLGARSDGARRDAIAAGTMRGPRILTSLGQIQPGSRSVEQLQNQIRSLKESGADVVKLFASGSIRDRLTRSAARPPGRVCARSSTRTTQPR